MARPKKIDEELLDQRIIVMMSKSELELIEEWMVENASTGHSPTMSLWGREEPQGLTYRQTMMGPLTTARDVAAYNYGARRTQGYLPDGFIVKTVNPPFINKGSFSIRLQMVIVATKKKRLGFSI